MLLLLCPHCKNQMRYNPNDSLFTGKKKRCVYCGKSFSVLRNIVKKVKYNKK